MTEKWDRDSIKYFLDESGPALYRVTHALFYLQVLLYARQKVSLEAQEAHLNLSPRPFPQALIPQHLQINPLFLPLQTLRKSSLSSFVALEPSPPSPRSLCSLTGFGTFLIFE